MKTNRVIIKSAEKFAQHRDEEPAFANILVNGVLNIDDVLINSRFFDACKRFNISCLIVRFSENMILCGNKDNTVGIDLLALRQSIADSDDIGMYKATQQLERVVHCCEEDYDVIIQYGEI